MSVVLEGEREFNKKVVIFVVLMLTFLVIGIVFALYVSLTASPIGEQIEPPKPHMSPAIMAKYILRG